MTVMGTDRTFIAITYHPNIAKWRKERIKETKLNEELQAIHDFYCID